MPRAEMAPGSVQIARQEVRPTDGPSGLAQGLSGQPIPVTLPAGASGRHSVSLPRLLIGSQRRKAWAAWLAGLGLCLAVDVAPAQVEPGPSKPPVLPAVQTQVHDVGGHRVTLDLYPAAGRLRGAAILSHGFTRSRRTLAGHAQALADAGVRVLTPDLPCTFDFRCNARSLSAMVQALREGETFGPPVARVVLVGFSAGGLSSLLAADAPGVVGYIGLDPFDRVMPGEGERLGLAAAGRLRTEALLLRAPPSRCNADAVAAPWGGVLPSLWQDRLIEGASHCDFESPTDWICRLACGAADPARQQQVRQGLLDAVDRWLP